MISFSRRTAIAAVTASLANNAALASTPVASPLPPGKTQCGITYDTGSELARGVFTRPPEHSAFYRDEIMAIRDQLHTRQIGLFGSNVDSLIEAMAIAADLEMEIKVQTRLNFIDPPEMLDRLKTVGTAAEQLRSGGTNVVFDVGCEYMVFADGILPGNDFYDKMEAIESPDINWQEVFSQLFGMLHTLGPTAREVFSGQITYSDTPMDAELWDPFDIITIDHYLGAESEHTYIPTINDLAATGKPVWIGEFGATASSGSPLDGGMSWDVIDYEAEPPQILEGVVSDESSQSQAIESTLELISASNAEQAYLYEFITPDAPRSDIPKFNWDVTAYGIVAVEDEDGDQPYADTGHWEPKEAFHTVAEWNRT